MEIIEDVSLSRYKDLSLALGFFDGIHKGHREVILNAVNLAKENRIKSAVITFKENPKSIIKDIKPCYILSLKNRIEFIRELKVDYLFLLDFNKELAKVKKEEYLKKYLIERYNPKFITIGFNHYFGEGREGNIDYLRQEEKNFKYRAMEIMPILDETGLAISSSRIKRLIEVGNIERANNLLGYKFFIENKVVRGNQIGRQIGFRTANIEYPEGIVRIPKGVYAVKVRIDGFEKEYEGVMNFGVKPTFDNNLELPIAEVNIFDFNEDIYDKQIRIEICSYIRKEMKFLNVEVLKEQIVKDVEQVRDYFVKNN